MFQYAAGKRLARVLDVELKLDISGLERDKFRRYSLGTFNIEEDFASTRDLAAITRRKSDLLGRLKNWLMRNPRNTTLRYVREKHFHFDPEILALPDGIYLDGYWQSEKYFLDIETVICREFTFKWTVANKNKDLAEVIASCDSVSVHVRRGDYISNPVTREVLGTCEASYYDRSVKELAVTVKAPHFFIFSDDVEWAQKNLKLDFPKTFVTHNEAQKDYEDLRLMSLCKHYIIANSSFSWWGAWLCENPDKIVFVPQDWFKTPKRDTRDLIPDSWNRI